ncbi:hypothetical protein HOF65_08290 [bacterium]|nr:hypothetical protein [bacterium]MBT3853882.1 hypothetical protein [bacterium]MBT4633071.1 hypothetical protein [bacterium]MBT6778615.1 hypothetical protein [bacterium]
MIHVLQLSHIIIHNFCNHVSTNSHLIGTLIFALSCLRFAVKNHQPRFILDHSIESQT